MYCFLGPGGGGGGGEEEGGIWWGRSVATLDVYMNVALQGSFSKDILDLG